MTTQNVEPDAIKSIDGNPSCLAFDPHIPNRLIVGTYNLTTTRLEDEDGVETVTQQKKGDLFVYNYLPDKNDV
jgi:hypothetical protein